MKKFISLFIALAMTMAMLPVHYAFAEGETTDATESTQTTFTVNPVAASNIGDVKIYSDAELTTAATNDIETEDTANAPSAGIKKATYSGLGKLGYGNEYLAVYGYTEDTSFSYDLTDSITVPATGYYNMKYAIGGHSGYAQTSKMKLEFAPAADPTAKALVTSYAPEAWTNTTSATNPSRIGYGVRDGQVVWSCDEEYVYLEAGTYKATFTIYGRGAASATQQHNFLLSPMEFINVTEFEAISATEKTTIEYEDYHHLGDDIVSAANASGTAVAGYYGDTITNPSVNIVIPVTVEEPAIYNFETVLGKGGWCGTTTVYVDGEELVANTAEGTSLEKNFKDNTSCPLYKFNGEILLTKGTHEIKVVNNTSLFRLIADYISFEKSNKPLSFTVTPAAKSNISSTAIYEDSAYTTAATIDITNTHTADPIPKGIYKSAEKDLVALGYGNEYLSVLGSVQTTKFSYDLTDTIVVPKTGYYKMRYAIGGNTGYSGTSNLKLEFAPKSNPTAKTLVTAYSHENWSNTSSGTDNPTRVGYGSIDGRIVWSNEEEYAYLEAGEYIATYTVYGSGSSSATNNYNLLVSPMEFTEATDFEEISTAAKTTIEYEDYSHYGNALATVANASGSAAIGYYGVNIASPAVSILIPVTVTEAGRYSWETVLGKGISDSTVYLDGEKLAASSDEGTSMECNFKDDSNYPMYKYAGEVELTKGTHEIKVTSSANLLRVAADYISFEKAPAKTHYAIQPYAPSTLDDAKWYTDAEKTTAATVNLTDVVDTYTPAAGVTKITYSTLRNKGFGDNYLSIRDVYAEAEDGTVAYTLDDTLKIEATDYYKLSYAIGGETGYGFSGVSVELENVNDSSDKNVILRYVAEDYSNDNTNAGAGYGALSNQSVYSNDFNEIAKIEEGEYKVNITIYLSQGYKFHRLTLSDINLDATDPVDVLADAKTTLEVEDYTHYGASKNQAEGGVADVSDNGIAWTHYGTPRGNVPVLINIPVNVEAEDDYVLETHMAKSTVGNTYIYVDGEQVVHNYTGGTLTGKTLFETGEYAMATYKETVHLTAGEHLITVSGSTAGNLLRFAVDYVSLEKWYENPVSKDAATRIEMEAYADEFAAAYGETEYESLLEEAHDYHYITLRTKPVAMVRFDDAGKNFSNNKAMFGVKETEDAKVVEIPVTIKDAGYYNAKYRVGGTGIINGFAWFDTELVAADGSAYSLSEAIYRESEDTEANVTQTRINDGAGSYTWQLVSSPAYVPAGTYTMKMTITGTTFLCDYIDIMPVAAVDATEGVDFDAMMVKAHAADTANGGSIEYSDWSYTDKQTEVYTYPITVPEDGYYDVEAVMHRNTGTDTSAIKIMIDDVVVYNNINSGEDLSDTDDDGATDYISNYFPVNKYLGGKIKLEAGTHELKVQTDASGEKVQYIHKFALDYAKLTKTTDEMYTDGNNLVIKANYGTEVSGKAYMAFYNGNKLVDVKEAGSVSGAEVEVGAVPPTDGYNFVKLLIWGNEVAPNAIAIGFAN